MVLGIEFLHLELGRADRDLMCSSASARVWQANPQYRSTILNGAILRDSGSSQQVQIDNEYWQLLFCRQPTALHADDARVGDVRAIGRMPSPMHHHHYSTVITQVVPSLLCQIQILLIFLNIIGRNLLLTSKSTWWSMFGTLQEIRHRLSFENYAFDPFRDLIHYSVPHVVQHDGVDDVHQHNIE